MTFNEDYQARLRALLAARTGVWAEPGTVRADTEIESAFYDTGDWHSVVIEIHGQRPDNHPAVRHPDVTCEFTDGLAAFIQALDEVTLP